MSNYFCLHRRNIRGKFSQKQKDVKVVFTEQKEIKKQLIFKIICDIIKIRLINIFGGKLKHNMKTEIIKINQKHIKTLNAQNILKSRKANKSIGCGECQASCQSACKTSCTVANQKCENK